MNDFPKLLRIIDIKSGLLPSIFVIFKLKIFFPNVWPVLYSKIIQYEKNKILVGIYIPSFVMNSSKFWFRYWNEIKKIEVDINEMMIKSIIHAKNLSLHFARMIFDELKLL